MRLFQSKLFSDLIQWEIYLTLQVSDLVQAPIEVKAVLLADFEQELDHPSLEEANSTTLRRGCLDLVSKLEELLVSDHNVCEQIQVSQVMLPVALT